MENTRTDQASTAESAVTKLSESSGSSSEHSVGRSEEKGDALHSKLSAKPPIGTSKYIVKTPTDHDVLFGRGWPYQSHPGNMNLHRLVAFHKDRYENSRRFDKLAIADQIVYEIKSGGGKKFGRFLRRVEGEVYWEEAPDDVSREKVAHALRGQIKKARENQKRKSSAAVSSGALSSSFVGDGSVAAPQNSSHFCSGRVARNQISLTSSESNAFPSVSTGIPRLSDRLSLLLQQHRNIQASRQALSSSSCSSLPSNPTLPILAAQQQQRQQLSQISNVSALQLALSGSSQSKDVSMEILTRLLAVQLQEPQQQVRLLLLHLLRQSNETNPVAAFFGTSRGHSASNPFLTEQLTSQNALAILQQQSTMRDNHNMLSSSFMFSAQTGLGTSWSGSNKAALAACELENANTNAAVERLLRAQQNSSRETDNS